jgi:hypothetical protein
MARVLSGYLALLPWFCRFLLTILNLAVFSYGFAVFSACHFFLVPLFPLAVFS